VYLGRDADGRRRYVTRTIRGKQGFAEDQLNSMLVEAGRSDQVVTEGTLGDLVIKWREVGTLNLSPTTLAEYERLLAKRILPRFGKTKVRAIRAADVDAFYAELQRGRGGAKPLGTQSIQHIHAVLRRLLNQAVRWGWISTSPIAKATPPRVRRFDLTIPDPQDIRRILSKCDTSDPDLGCFLRLAAVTGARRGELCALRWSDVGVTFGSLSIARSLVGNRNDDLVEKGTKTHASRRVSLDSTTLASLEVHRRRCTERALACGAKVPKSAFVFSDSPDGATPWRPDRVTRAFRRLSDGLGITGVRLHDLRHFAATQLLAAGVPVKTVATRLGHANASTTLNVYAHHLESSDEEAAQVLGGLIDGPARSVRFTAPSQTAREAQ
jgi:integrase